MQTSAKVETLPNVSQPLRKHSLKAVPGSFLYTVFTMLYLVRKLIWTCTYLKKSLQLKKKVGLSVFSSE